MSIDTQNDFEEAYKAEDYQPYLGYKERFDIPTNKFGLTCVDHVGIPARDPEMAGKFLEEILGGVEVYKAGYSDNDIALGRPKHIFYHIGTTAVEVAQQTDGVYPAADAVNNHPHWAFGTDCEGLLRFADHLRENNIPFDGPRSHKGTSVVSVYFRDPDGNNLEVCTFEDVPEEHTTPMGGPYGFPVWADMVYDWTPKS